MIMNSRLSILLTLAAACLAAGGCNRLPGHVAAASQHAVAENQPFGASTVSDLADKDVENLLSHMREAYQGVKAATYETDSDVFTDQGKRSFNVDFAYKQPNMIRAIVKGDALPGVTVTVVTDGQTINVSNTMAGPEPEQKFTLDDFEKIIAMDNLESLCFYDWDRQLSTTPGKNMAKSTFHIVKNEDWNGKKWLVLEESAKDNNVFCRYFIDPKTYFIWRTNVTQLSDKKPVMDARLTKLDTNAKLDDTVFKGT